MNLSIHVVKITQYELWNWNFRYDVWPQGHLPTNYTKWRTAKAMYTVSDIQSAAWKSFKFRGPIFIECQISEGTCDNFVDSLY